jgi:glycosyltransferase involved in cell wall biosynthesis
MPVYNGKNYFESALRSAIASISNEDEIIVVEDGSVDGGVGDIIKKYVKQAKIKYFVKNNGGVGSALNFGIEKAENAIFAWLSHDDIYLPNRFNSDRNLRALVPDIITVTNFYLYNQKDKKCMFINSSKKIGSRQKIKLLAHRFLNGNTITIPINIIKSFGGFDESLMHTQDYDLWCKILKDYNFSAIPDSTVISRQHIEQDSKKKPTEALREYKILIRKNLTLKDVIDPRNFFKVLQIFSSLYLNR